MPGTESPGLEAEAACSLTSVTKMSSSELLCVWMSL